MLAFIGFTIWTLSETTVRSLRDYPISLIAFCASVVAVFLLLGFSPYLGGIKKTFTMPQLKLRLLRGCVIATSCFLGFFTFTQLEMTTAYAIFFIAPILAKIISSLFIKESIKPMSWVLSLIGFVGVLIVLQPSNVPFSLGSLSALGLAIFFAIGHTLARYIDDKNQTYLSLALFQYIIIAAFSAYPAYLSAQNLNIQMIPSFDLVRLFAVGVFTASGALLVSRGFSMAPVAYIAPIHYTQIIMGTLWGYLFFAEIPSQTTLFGAGLVIFAGLGIMYMSGIRFRRIFKNKI